MSSAVASRRAVLVEERGWVSGTALENTCALLLGTAGLGPGVLVQQLRVGRYRLDFAHLPSHIAIEADGWWHRSPEGASRDAERDAWLRKEGWLVLRVDDQHGEEALRRQLSRVAEVLWCWIKEHP